LPLARAKRTDRAEARRRYRAQLAAEDESFDEAEDTGRPATPAPPTPSAPARPGIRSAFSQAFRPLDLRGDLRYLPTLVRQRSVLIPITITLAATALYLVLIAGRPGQLGILEVVVAYVFQIFVLPPPVGSSFLAGFLAVKASWLAGILVAIVSSVCYTILISTTQTTPGTTTEGGQQLIGLDPVSLLLQVALFSVAPASLFAALAAWYKRFLNLANPNRARIAAARQREAAKRARNPRLARR
jgi:hypothetical protein